MKSLSVLRILQFVAALMIGGSWLATAEDRVRVIVSIPPQQWLVEQIGGEKVDVEVLVAPGESPTTYLPTDAQVTHFMRAQIYFSIGVPFEKGLWFEAVRRMGRFLMVDLRQGIELRGDDPHTWLSPPLLAIQARTAATALSHQDPNRRALYEANLQRLLDRLEILDEDLHRALDPYAGRSFMVFHPSWAYFADAYALQQIAIEIEGREPSDRELTRLQAAARESGITTVFVQPQIHGRSAQAFARSIEARLETLDPLAADVAANLAETASKLRASFRRGTPGEE